MRNRELTERLGRLADALEGVDLRGAQLGADAAIVDERDRLAGTVRNYLIPRTTNPDAPLMVVFAGPTGAGKSTLVNSVSGLHLTVAGAVRPTTSLPLVLAGSSEDATRVAAGSGAQAVVGAAPILEHMTFVDTPDIDSTSTGHRVIAESFIDRADIVVFVVSASRYADGVPWEVLRRAMSRGAAVVPVVNRLGPGGSGVMTDYGNRLKEAGLDQAPVRVPEHHLEPGAQKVPALAVRELQRRLFKVAKAQRAYQAAVLARVLNGTTLQAAELADRVDGLRSNLDDVARAIAKGMSKPPAIHPDPARTWAAGPPSTRRLPAWISRLISGGDQAAWNERVHDALAAELESRLRSDLAGYGALVFDGGPRLSDFASRAPAMLAGVVDSWVRYVGRVAEAAGERGPEALISSILHGGPDTPDAEERVVQGRQDLEGRLEVVWQHFGSLLVEAWWATAGDPDPGDLRRLAADVAAAHDFADA